MFKKTKYLLIFITILIACMSIAVAANTNDTTVCTDVADTVEVDTITTADTQAVASVNEDNNYKTLEKESKTVKRDENDSVEVTSEVELNDLFDNIVKQNPKSEGGDGVVAQYTVLSDNDLTIYGNGTAVITLEPTNEATKLLVYGSNNPYKNVISESEVEVTDVIVYLTSLNGNVYYPKDLKEIKFDLNNKENINLKVIGSSLFKIDYGLIIRGNWKSVTYENFKITASFNEEDLGGANALVLKGNDITLRNSTFVFTPVDRPSTYSEYVEDAARKNSGLYIVGENILIEDCQFTNEIYSLRWNGDRTKNYTQFGIFIHNSTNVTFNNNELIFTSTDKDSSIDPLENYGQIIYGYNELDDIKFINNEITARYVPGITLVTSNSVFENNTISVMHADTTIELAGDNNIVRYNTLTSQSAEGDATVITTGQNNIVEANLPEPVVVEPELKVDTTEFTVGSTATISASIYYGENVATNISKGKVTFKVNGKTLKDANGKVIYAKLINGTATIEGYEVPQDWTKENTTIQAVYSGSGDIAKMSTDKITITVTSQEPSITTEDVTATVGSTVTFTATINAATPVNTGKVVFKINGKTVKDANGKVIYAKVTDGVANVTYTIPDDMKAEDYNITTVFISSDYGRLEDVKTLTITG